MYESSLVTTNSISVELHRNVNFQFSIHREWRKKPWTFQPHKGIWCSQLVWRVFVLLLLLLQDRNEIWVFMAWVVVFSVRCLRSRIDYTSVEWSRIMRQLLLNFDAWTVQPHTLLFCCYELELSNKVHLLIRRKNAWWISNLLRF